MDIYTKNKSIRISKLWFVVFHQYRHRPTMQYRWNMNRLNNALSVNITHPNILHIFLQAKFIVFVRVFFISLLSFIENPL